MDTLGHTRSSTRGLTYLRNLGNTNEYATSARQWIPRGLAEREPVVILARICKFEHRAPTGRDRFAAGKKWEGCKERADTGRIWS